MAGTTRQQKFSRLIQKELSDIFQRDKRGILGNAFITIADVKMSPDLSVARIFISMMLAKDKEKTLEQLNLHKREIRKALGDKIGKQVRIIPELIFILDEVEENAQRLDDLIKNLNIPPTGMTKRDGLPVPNKRFSILNLSYFIARRYLFSKRKTNFINIISILSMGGVAFITAALIIVSSVFNGLEDLLRSLNNSFDPEIKIQASKGKSFEIVR